MKKILILAYVAIVFVSCTGPKESTKSQREETKEDFFPLLFSQHVEARKWNSDFISNIQIYAGNTFQLNASAQNESDKVENGVVVFERKIVERTINFKDKLKGKIIEVSKDRRFVRVQFHDGSDNNIGPPIWFGSKGEEYFIAPNSKDRKSVEHNGIIYKPSTLDVYLVLKGKDRIDIENQSFDASGVDVSGKSSSTPADSQVDTPPKENEVVKEDTTAQPTTQPSNQTTPTPTQSQQKPSYGVQPKQR